MFLRGFATSGLYITCNKPVFSHDTKDSNGRGSFIIRSDFLSQKNNVNTPSNLLDSIGNSTPRYVRLHDNINDCFIDTQVSVYVDTVIVQTNFC